MCFGGLCAGRYAGIHSLLYAGRCYRGSGGYGGIRKFCHKWHVERIGIVMNYREANSKSNTFLIIAMVLLLGAVLMLNWVAQMICLRSGVVLIIIAIVLRVKYSRCPHCKKKLPLGFRSEPEKCPHCTEILIKEENKQ